MLIASCFLHCALPSLCALGGFSFVDLVRSDHGVHYALKRILCQSSEQLAAARREIDLHSAISHPFVLSLVVSEIREVKQSGGGGGHTVHEALLLFPLYPNGSIVDVVQRWHAAAQAAASLLASSPRSGLGVSQAQPWPFAEHEALRLFYAIAQGLQAMHAAGYAHRDLKPHNILLAGERCYANPHAAQSPASASASAAAAAAPGTGLASEPTPIVIDLGSASPIPETPVDRRAASIIQDRAAEHSTASYRAPELWDVRPGIVLDERGDLFSLGLILYFMAFGSSAFENEIEGVLTLAIRQGRVTFPEGAIIGSAGAAVGTGPSSSSSLSPPSPPPPALHPSRQFSSDFAQFIRDLLQPDPLLRMSLKAAMKKSVVLMMAALERANSPPPPPAASGAAAAGSASAAAGAADDGEDEFGDFASASNPAPASSTTASAAATASTLPSPAALDLLITDMQLGSSASASSSGSGSGSSSSGSGGAGGGGGFLKFGRKGSPHPTRLQLSADKRSLSWTSRPSRVGVGGEAGAVNLIPLSRVFALVTGQRTEKFKRARQDSVWAKKSHLCFSLLLKPGSAASASSASAPGGTADEVDPASGEETLDLLADSHSLYRTWTTGLQALLTHPELAEREDQGIGAEAPPTPAASPKASPAESSKPE